MAHCMVVAAFTNHLLDLFEAAASAAFSLAYCNPVHYLTNDKQVRKWQICAYSFL